VAQRKTVTFTYYAIERDETTVRTVDPYSLMLAGEEWYLLGYCRLREAVRTFRLSRIRSRVRHATRAAHDFAPPPRFALREYLNRAPWQLGPPAHEAVVRVTPAMAWWVEAHFAAAGAIERGDDDATDGAILYRTRYASADQLVAWALQLGEDAEIVEPTDLRALLAARLKRIVARLDTPPAVDPTALRRLERRQATAGGQGAQGRRQSRGSDRLTEAGGAQRHGDRLVEVDRFTRLSTLMTYLLERCRGEGEVVLEAAAVCRDLDLTPHELKADVRLLNLVNFGGDGAVLWAEVKRGKLEVTCDLAASAFSAPARLSPLQADVLLLAIELVGGQLPVNHGTALRAAASKLAAARSAASPSLGAADTLPPEARVLDAVNEAVRRRRLLEIEYWSEGTSQTTTRVVEPYLMVRSRGEWYYVSWCRTSRGRRTFRVATTKKARLLDETFTPRPAVELDLYRREGIPATARWAPRSAVVWYSPAVRRWVEERQPVVALPDGGCIAAQPYVDEPWLVHHLLAFGGEALPLAPSAAARALREAAARLLVRYDVYSAR
jgi:proteasome accessory factor C